MKPKFYIFWWTKIQKNDKYLFSPHFSNYPKWSLFSEQVIYYIIVSCPAPFTHAKRRGLAKYI